MLNLLKPTVDPRETLLPVRKIDTAAEFGAVITRDNVKYTVMFSKDSLDKPRLEIGR